MNPYVAVGLEAAMFGLRLARIQRAHDADPREHRRAIALYDEDQGLNSVEPVGLDTFSWRHAHEEFGHIPKRPKRPGGWVSGYDDGVIECSPPTPFGHPLRFTSVTKPSGISGWSLGSPG